MRTKRQAGVSMLEVVITLSIMSIVSVASVWLVFTTLSLRDLVLATTATSESLRVLSHALSRAVRGASVVGGSPTSLLITSVDECWSFVYDADVKNLPYAKKNKINVYLRQKTGDPVPPGYYGDSRVTRKVMKKANFKKLLLKKH